jgi:hypothetical protein
MGGGQAPISSKHRYSHGWTDYRTVYGSATDHMEKERVKEEERMDEFLSKIHEIPVMEKSLSLTDRLFIFIAKLKWS